MTTPRIVWLSLFLAGLVAAGAVGAAPPADAPPDTLSASSTPSAPVRLSLLPAPTPGATPGVGEPGVAPPPEAPKPARLESLDGMLRYNPVEGFAFGLKIQRRLDPKNFYPAVHATAGYAFSARTWEGSLGFEQPLARRHKLTVGGEGYSHFLPFFYENEVFGSAENTLSSVLLHENYWSFYQTQGLYGFLGLYTSPFVRITLGIRDEEERALSNNTNWSLFNQKSVFPPNPTIPSGNYRGYEATAAYDARPRDPEGNVTPRSSWGGLVPWLRLGWIRGNGGLGGDFDLWKVTADLRTYFRLTPQQRLDARILLGTGESASGPLPEQRLYAVGGYSTLRAYRYREFQGNRVALGNLEYSFALGRQAWGLVFVDGGLAWSDGSLTDQRIPVDVGAGLRLSTSGITLLGAHSINDGGGVNVLLRLQESF